MLKQLLQRTHSHEPEAVIGPTDRKWTLVVALGVVLTAIGSPILAGTEQTATGARFQILSELSEEAVLDRETHLIWERFPSTEPVSWSNAARSCALKGIGGYHGWRLPTFFELMSLVDPSVRGTATKPALPTGHPFSSARATSYWSKTAVSDDPSKAYLVDFLRGDVLGGSKREVRQHWCVRMKSSELTPERPATGPQVTYSGSSTPASPPS